jgi:hypothetical protein
MRIWIGDLLTLDPEKKNMNPGSGIIIPDPQTSAYLAPGPVPGTKRAKSSRSERGSTQTIKICIEEGIRH